MKAKTYVKSMKNYGIKSNNSDNYNEKYIKIKINSDDDLPLKKTLELHNMIIVVRSVFHEDSKYYQQFFFFQMLYFDRIDSSESIDVNKTMASKECIICPNHYCLDKGLKF